MYFTTKTIAAVAAMAGFASAAPLQSSSTPLTKRDFNAGGSNNVAAWWGNSPMTNQAGLDDVCNAEYDIVILTFGMAINGQEVTVGGGAESKSLASSIKKCQAAGKKVMMSMGGATATQLIWSSDEQAANAADVVAKQFLTSGSGSYYGVALDGIDIDNETSKSAHWLKFVQQLRTHMSKSQYISGAPQCPMPDQNLDQETLKAMDFVWVQFYNNGPCNHGQSGFADSVKKWSSYVGDAKLYIATPGSAASAGSGYIDAGAMSKEVADVKAMNLPNLGGYAIWDGSTAIVNDNYENVIKKALGGSTSSGSGSGSGTGSGSGNSTTGTGSDNGPTSTKPHHHHATTDAGHGQHTGAPGSGGQQTVQATSTAVITSTQFMPTPTGGATFPTGNSTSTGGNSTTGTGSGSGAAGTQPCSDAGKVVCSSDGSKFGICDGSSAFMMAVASGTTCSNGQISAVNSGSSGSGSGSGSDGSDDTPTGASSAAMPSSTGSSDDSSDDSN